MLQGAYLGTECGHDQVNCDGPNCSSSMSRLSDEGFSPGKAAPPAQKRRSVRTKAAPDAPATAHHKTALADAPIRGAFGPSTALVVQEPFGSGSQFVRRQVLNVYAKSQLLAEPSLLAQFTNCSSLSGCSWICWRFDPESYARHRRRYAEGVQAPAQTKSVKMAYAMRCDPGRSRSGPAPLRIASAESCGILPPCASPTRCCHPRRCGPLSRNLSPATARIIRRSSDASKRSCVNSTLGGSSCISTPKPRPATSFRWKGIRLGAVGRNSGGTRRATEAAGIVAGCRAQG